MMRTLTQAIAFGETAAEYQRLRQQHPTEPARHVKRYIDAQAQAYGLTLQQFECKHEFAYTGTQYGGDDDSYRGEGRCYCVHCGLDGDS